MGDPKFLRRTYDTPKHPWEAGRMDEERKLLEKYGLKNKRELWKAQSILRGFRRQARDLQARLRAGEPQAQRETAGLLGRLTRLGVLSQTSASIDDVLALTTEDVLRRRFEWIVFHRELAPTAKGARQWIVHGHFSIGDHRVTRPGYLVPAADETRISYSPTSPLSEDDHSQRAALRERLTARSAPAEVPPAPATEA
jgi:small subunit ribosomal protein S4